MIQWKHGLLRSPDGLWMRQVPAKHAWSSALWVSKCGQVWRRFYNAVRQEWHWDEEGAVVHVEDEQGRMGIYLDRGFTLLEVVIALAWLHRAPETPMKVTVREGRPIHARYISWLQGESNEERGTIRDETWRPLKVRCGVVRCPDGYMISSEGRLKAPDGDVTEGYYFEGIAGHTRLAAVKDCGLVDLGLASKILPNAIYFKPHLKTAADAMMSDVTPAQFALETSIQLDTAWSYYRGVAEFVPVTRIKEIAPKLVDKHLWRLLHELKAEGDDRLGGPLKPLMEVVQNRLPLRSDFWQIEGQMAMLAFGRLCVLKL